MDGVHLCVQEAEDADDEGDSSDDEDDEEDEEEEEKAAPSNKRKACPSCLCSQWRGGRVQCCWAAADRQRAAS